MIIPKGNHLYAISHMRCPRCNEGKLFENPNPFVLKQVVEMPAQCSHCGLKFERETGFFYGAMYVSYALNVAFGVALYIAMHVFTGAVDLFWYVIGFILLTLLFFPLFMRLSRVIWLCFFVKYKKPERSVHQSEK